MKNMTHITEVKKQI